MIRKLQLKKQQKHQETHSVELISEPKVEVQLSPIQNSEIVKENKEIITLNNQITLKQRRLKFFRKPVNNKVRFASKEEIIDEASVSKEESKS